MRSKEEVIQILEEVKDPEIPVLSVNDMGIIRDVEFFDDHTLVTITSTYTGCPAMDLIEKQIIEELEKNGVSNPKVKLTLDPPWSTDWISEDGLRKILNVVLIGNDDKIDHLAKDTFGSYSLTGRAYVLYQWIACLKVINKYYKDIFLPPFEDVKRIVECTMKKFILDDSLKTTNPITIGIENSIGDDVAKVRTNNSNELSVALNYSKNDTTEKNIIKNENTDIDSNDLFQEEVSYSISQSMVTSRIKQKNDGNDLERSILKSALNALDVNIDKSKDDKVGGKMSDINESRRSDTPINDFLS